MAGEFTLKRRLYRDIANQVSSVEGAEALRCYLVSKVPGPFSKEPTDDLKVFEFLVAHRADVDRIPSGVLLEVQNTLLRPDAAEHFKLSEASPSTLAVIVRFLVPIVPGGQPDPSNSIWKTRLKLLGNSGGLVSFVKLWRLSVKYEHNQEMNQSIPEIEHDFDDIELAILLLTKNTCNVRATNKVARFKRLTRLIEAERDISTLKETSQMMHLIAADLHADDSQLQQQLSKHLRALVRSTAVLS